MKKLFLTAVLAVVTLTASAQVYVGGELGFWRDWDANKTEFTLAPEVGYNLSDKWAVGLEFMYNHDYDGHKRNTVGIAPYARFTYAKWGPVNLFLDGGFLFAASKVKDTDSSSNAWNVGIKPGLSVDLTEKLSFITHVGFLGYQDADDSYGAFKRGFGFDLKGHSLTFGINYNF